MLTSKEFDQLLIPLSKLYGEFSQSILDDMARRISKMKFVSPASAWQFQRLIESGKLHDDILKKLAQMTGASEKKLASALKQAGVKSMKFDDSVYEAVGLKPLPLNLSPAMASVLKIGIQQTNGLLNNLTRTTAKAMQNKFIDSADLAWLQVTSGALDYNTAIKRAVISVADQGVNVIQFASGATDKLDVAMRRTVLTGIGQTAGKLQITRMNEMGTDLVQVSSHSGARPSHARWQGGIYSRGGTSEKYPDFVESTGYGSGAGLAGWNCRHSFYPFFEELSENAYSAVDQEIAANASVELDGKQVPLYEATQQQRLIERNIRGYKRRVSALNAAGLDSSPQMLNLQNWQARARDFTKQTGLPRQPAREGGRVLARPRILSKVGSKAGSRDVVAEAHSLTSTKGIEKIFVLDDNNNVLWEKLGTKGHVDELILPKGASKMVHNHPNFANFSEDDIRTFLDRKQIKESTIVIADGDVFSIKKTTTTKVSTDSLYRQSRAFYAEGQKLFEDDWIEGLLTDIEFAKKADSWRLKKMSELYNFDYRFVKNISKPVPKATKLAELKVAPARREGLRMAHTGVARSNVALNESVEAWKKKLTKDELSAISSYTSSNYHTINAKLRQGLTLVNNAHTGMNIRTWVENLDSAIKKVVATAKDYQVTRRVINNSPLQAKFLTAIENNQLVVGDIISEKAYTSTTIVSNIARPKPGNINFDIFIPKGSKNVAFLDGLSDYGDEMEFLFGRGAKFKYIGIDLEGASPTIFLEFVK